MAEQEGLIHSYKGFKWIVHHPDLLGGQPTIRGTRIPVSLVLQGMSEGTTAEEFVADYPGFPVDAVPEVLRFAAQQLSRPVTGDDDDVAA